MSLPPLSERGINQQPDILRSRRFSRREFLVGAGTAIAATLAIKDPVDTLNKAADSLAAGTKPAEAAELPKPNLSPQLASTKPIAEQTPIAENYEQLRSLELITDATLESASISGTDIAMIQTFKDGTKHLIAGSLIDPNLPPLDMGTLPISPLKVARRGNIIVAVGGQLSSIDQGAIWISMDGGKTGITVTDSSGQFLEVSIPDTKSVFLVEGDRMAENQPAYLKMINLARPNEIKLLGAANPYFTSDALKLQSASNTNTYRILSLDFRNFGYWVKIIQDGQTISNTLNAQDQGFIYNPPLQFYDIDGKIVDAVMSSRGGVPPNNPDWSIGSIIYIKEGQQLFLIQPWQELVVGSATTAVFNRTGDGYMAVYNTSITNEGDAWANPYIIKLGRDYKDFTQQQLIAQPGVNGFPQKLQIATTPLYLLIDPQGQEKLYAVTDKGVFKYISGDLWEQVNTYKIASDPPTPTLTPTPTPTPRADVTPTPVSRIALSRVSKNAKTTPDSFGPGW